MRGLVGIAFMVLTLAPVALVGYGVWLLKGIAEDLKTIRRQLDRVP